MSKEYKIVFLPLDRKALSGEGKNVLEIAMQAGVHINASCGGNGVCGKCRIKVREGTVVSESSTNISRSEYDTGVRLACQSSIKSDAVIEIPLESQIDKSTLKRTAGDTHISSDFQARRLFENIPVKPQPYKLYMELPEPTRGDNIADLDRIIRGLCKVFPEWHIAAPLDIMIDLAKLVRESQWKITVTLAPCDHGFRVIRIEPGDTAADMYSIAIDVGTTTVCGRLIDVSVNSSQLTAHRQENTQGKDGQQLVVYGEKHKTGRLVAEAADYNGQISFGEDVISRIMYARKKGGLKKLQAVLIKTINSVIRELLIAGGIGKHRISQVIFAGNTTMTHLLLGIDPTYIMLEPYTPIATSFPPVQARYLGIEVEGDVYACTLPCVASYIGGDIVAGVLASGMMKQEEVSLFMDIGTNGEIVLGNREWLLSASCSAGPAFEGGGIRFGMRASRGAIERVRINPSTFEPMIFTVEKAKPAGICGSGLIDIASGLLETGLIDQKGKFKRHATTKRVREGADGYEYVLCFAPETEIGRDIVITEIDLDNLIRSKAAVYAGCKVLLDSAGLTFFDLDRVVVAGGFGHYIDIERAKAIGLLPELPAERFHFIGNGSLSGAHLVSLNSDVRLETEKIAKMITNVELSNNNGFMEEFVAAMFLPHTDLGLFPEIAEKLKGL